MDKIISVYLFFILAFTATAIVYMVSNYYGYPYDVREVEASILANNVADCFSFKGELNQELFKNESFNDEFKRNFLEECNLNFEPEETIDYQEYYIKADFFGVEDLNKNVFSIEDGNLNIASECEIQRDKEYEKLSKCVERRFYSLKDDKQYLIKILTGVRKVDKNAK